MPTTQPQQTSQHTATKLFYFALFAIIAIFIIYKVIERIDSSNSYNNCVALAETIFYSDTNIADHAPNINENQRQYLQDKALIDHKNALNNCTLLLH